MLTAMVTKSMREAIKGYFQKHWVGMLFGAIPTAIMAFITLVSVIVNFLVAYNNLRLSVEANTAQLKSLAGIHTEILSNEIQAKQKLSDEESVLANIQLELNDIHRYFFDVGKR